MLLALQKMFPNPMNFQLKFTSASGTSASTFDSNMKSVGSFLIVIKATTGYVFGAYVKDSLSSGSGWSRGSLETFLFTFGTGNSPVKLLHNGSGNGIHLGSCGLHLGSDLVAFCSHTCQPSVYTQVAPGYSATVNSSLLAGTTSYSPSLMEVFAQC